MPPKLTGTSTCPVPRLLLRLGFEPNALMPISRAASATVSRTAPKITRPAHPFVCARPAMTSPTNAHRSEGLAVDHQHRPVTGAGQRLLDQRVVFKGFHCAQGTRETGALAELAKLRGAALHGISVRIDEIGGLHHWRYGLPRFRRVRMPVSRNLQITVKPVHDSICMSIEIER